MQEAPKVEISTPHIPHLSSFPNTPTKLPPAILVWAAQTGLSTGDTVRRKAIEQVDWKEWQMGHNGEPTVEPTDVSWVLLFSFPRIFDDQRSSGTLGMVRF